MGRNRAGTDALPCSYRGRPGPTPAAMAPLPLREFLARQSFLLYRGGRLLAFLAPGHPMPRAYAHRQSDRPADRSFMGVRRFASPAVKAVLARRWRECLGVLCGLSGLAL